VEASADAILSLDTRRIITSWNTGAERVYGYAASEVVGRSVAAIVPEGGEEEVPGTARGRQPGMNRPLLSLDRAQNCSNSSSTGSVAAALGASRDAGAAALGASRAGGAGALAASRGAGFAALGTGRAAR
jgi:transcriptional regulator with PAS, ATPase and Fis domain